MQAMLPVIGCARRLMPKAKIAVVGQPGAWNHGLRPYLHFVDGITHHTYAPTKSAVNRLPLEHQLSFVAGYSRAGLRSDLAKQQQDLGVRLSMWVTEFGVGLDPDDNCLLPELIYGTIHGVFHVARVLAAIEAMSNEPGAVEALCFERFVFADPQTTNQPNDWCGMPAGTVQQNHPHRPDLARVTGEGQLVAHLFGRALEAQLMHPVKISSGPMLATLILGDLQPCLQGAAFSSSGAINDSMQTTIAVLNICNFSIAMTLHIDSNMTYKSTWDQPSVAPHKGSTPASKVLDGGGKIVWYDLLDRGGKAPLPRQPDVFPWPGPLQGHHGNTDGNVYTAAPLSFAIIEMV